jgi:hypothetical protein
MIKVTPKQRAVLAFVVANPGVTRLAIDRSCRTAKGGHQWMYAMVKRMVKAGSLAYGPAVNKRGRGVYPAVRVG